MPLTELTEKITNTAELLSRDEIEIACSVLLDKKVDAKAKAYFLLALENRGARAAEIAEFVENFAKLSVKANLPDDGIPSIDIVGTGGDHLSLFNVSTATCFIVAGGGIRVVKHGNRAATSKCGGADVLEALGANINSPSTKVAEILHRSNFVFLFAQMYHPHFKAVAPARGILAKKGKRSIFNIIGPLLNPCQPEYQLLGVYDPSLLNLLGEVLQKLGREHAWVLCGRDSFETTAKFMDEVSTLGKSKVVAVEKGESLRSFEIDPRELALQRATLDELRGSSAKENARIIREVLLGDGSLPRLQIALLNAACAFVIAKVSESLAEAYTFAQEVVKSGKAIKALENYITASNK